MDAGNLQIVLVTVITSLIAPAVLAIILGINARKMHQLDMARQDVVSRKLDVANQKRDDHEVITEEAAAVTINDAGKLDTIHRLVNSQMTAALQKSLDSAIRERAALLALHAINPLPETQEALERVDKQIAEDRATLNDRLGRT